MTIFSSLMGNDAFPDGIDYCHDRFFGRNDSRIEYPVKGWDWSEKKIKRENVIIRRSGRSPKKKG
jgi:hypothetical protein